MGSQLENECIKVDKVYDWLTNRIDETKTIAVPAALLTAINAALAAGDTISIIGALPLANVTSSIINIVYGIPVVVNGCDAVVSCVQILKSATATITVNDVTTGLQLGQFDTTQQFLEKVALCVPEGLDATNIHIKPTLAEVTILTSVPIDGNINAVFSICQDIQVETEVKLQVIAAFCNPRPDDIQCPSTLPAVCPTPSFPEQCPNVYPRRTCATGNTLV